MPPDFRIGLLALGAVLVLGAILGGRILAGAVSALNRNVARAAVGVIGAALIAWVLPSYLGSNTPPAHQPAVASALPVISSPPVDLVRAVGSELSGCAVATAPSVPDGASASLAQMAESRRAFEAYDAATNAYVKCVDATVDRVAKQQRGAASESDLKRLKTFGAAAHNVTIGQEQALADQFNTQIRTYKAKHSK